MPRILVIDDEEMVRLTVVRALEQVGHTVIEAVDGNDGLVKYRQGSVDLVITDILMPGKEASVLSARSAACRATFRLSSCRGACGRPGPAYSMKQPNSAPTPA